MSIILNPSVFPTFFTLQSRKYIKHRILLHSPEFESSFICPRSQYLPIVTLGSLLNYSVPQVPQSLSFLQNPFVILLYFLLPWNLIACAIHLGLSVSFIFVYVLSFQLECKPLKALESVFIFYCCSITVPREDVFIHSPSHL